MSYVSGIVETMKKRDTQWRRRLEIQRIRADARAYATEHLDDRLFVAGTVLYWAEGSKTERRLEMAHSEPAALRLFVAWTAVHLMPDPSVVLRLHLHADNDETAAKSLWRAELGNHPFTKTFRKPDGSGHRRNHLPHGVCRAVIRRSTDAFHRAMTFVDVIRASVGAGETANLPSGR